MGPTPLRSDLRERVRHRVRHLERQPGAGHGGNHNDENLRGLSDCQPGRSGAAARGFDHAEPDPQGGPEVQAAARTRARLATALIDPASRAMATLRSSTLLGDSTAAFLPEVASVPAQATALAFPLPH